MVSRVVRATVAGAERTVDLLSGQSPIPSNLAHAPGYLANPGMGYQGFTNATGSLPSMVEYRRGNHELQGGFNWAAIHTGPTTFNWSPIDTVLAQNAARGAQLSFRIMTMLGDGYGGDLVPQWVKTMGATIRSNEEPDYRNRHYLTQFGIFMTALAARYDGDPRIAFIDISGYGKYNEWQENAWTLGDPASPGTTADAWARRMLVHMHTGGSGTATVMNSDMTTTTTVSYSYAGFTKTQLIMPYGGTWSTTRWVLANYPTVGWRNDALLGPDSALQTYRLIGSGIDHLWKTAPVIFEPIDPALKTLSYAEGSRSMNGLGAVIFHDNSMPNDSTLAPFVERVGYRYHPYTVRGPSTVKRGTQMLVEIDWTNLGYSRAYPKMGQDFAPAIALGNTSGVATSWTGSESMSAWLPGERRTSVHLVTLPATMTATGYTLLVGVVNRTGGARILLPVNPVGRSDRWYPVRNISVTAS